MFAALAAERVGIQMLNLGCVLGVSGGTFSVVEAQGYSFIYRILTETWGTEEINLWLLDGALLRNIVNFCREDKHEGEPGWGWAGDACKFVTKSAIDEALDVITETHNISDA